MQPSIYNGSEPYIFVSYAHRDSETVLPILAGLQSRGFRVWYDAGIEAGTEWPEYIAEHLVKSHCVVAFISAASLDSQNCRREINFAISQTKQTLAVYLEDVEMSYGMQMQLGTLQAIFYARAASHDAFLDTLAGAELLRPCRGCAEDAPAPSQSVHDLSADVCYRHGCAAFHERNYSQAVHWYREAAEQGYAPAQHDLGYCFKHGIGTEQNDREAARWFLAAAVRSMAAAQYSYGACLEQGCGVAQNYKEALFWYELAAGKGHADAAAAAERCRKALKKTWWKR